MKIAVYPGSFDPIHLGHLEIIRSVAPLVDSIYIIHNVPNKTKFLRSSNNDRLSMIKIAINNLDKTIKSKVKYSDDICDNIVIELKKDSTNILIGIIGMDAWSNIVTAGKAPKLNVDTFLIVPRITSNTVTINNSYLNASVTLISYNYKYQDYSSSEIRRFILWNKNTTSAHDLIKFNKYLPAPVQKYIKTNKLYDIRYYSKLILQTDNVIQHNSSPVCFTDTHVVKFFKSRDELNNIIIAHQNLLSYNMVLCKILQIIDQSPIYAIVMNRIIGLTIYDAVKLSIGHVFKKKSLLDCHDNYPMTIGYKLGALIRQLHNIKTPMLPSNFLNNHPKINKIKKFIPDIEEQLAKYPLHNLTGCVHGDANLGNFIIVKNDNTIVLIDYKLNYNLPAYEYYQMLSSIDKQINNNKRILLKNGFIIGYGAISDSYKIFETYWNKRNEFKSDLA
jgi:cytidyltransferase-like protein